MENVAGEKGLVIFSKIQTVLNIEFTRRTSQVRVASRVRVTSQIFFSVFFFCEYTNDVRAVTRNINFPVIDIFHSRSKEPLPLRIAVASPRCTTTFHINTFSKNTKAYNRPFPIY